MFTVIYFIIAFLIVLADQGVKYWVTASYGMGGHLDLIPGIFRITYVSNSGGAFSVLSDHTLILSIVSAVACLVLIILLITMKKASPLGRLSLAFILGGAIGNMIDRFLMGYVVDMFQPLFINFAVFNVADIFITVGAVMLVVYIIFFWRSDKKKTAPEPAGEVYPPKPDHKMSAKERREYNRARKYGPDVDESTVHIPVDQIKTALGNRMTDDTIVVKPNTKVQPQPDASEAPAAPVSPAEPSAPKEKSEFTLEEIMKEYGHDF